MINQALKKLFLLCVPDRIFMHRCASNKPSIYLTFDDGPTPLVTEELIDLLDQYNATATFFVIGNKLKESLDIGKKIVTAGHAIGNHSLDHNGFASLSLDKQVDQALAAQIIIDQLDGNCGRLFRSPQGHWSLYLIFKLFFKKFKCIHWTYDSMDYADYSISQIIKGFENKPVKKGDIILFHDDASKSIAVLKVMLPRWVQQGYTFGRIK